MSYFLVLIIRLTFELIDVIEALEITVNGLVPLWQRFVVDVLQFLFFY